MVRSRWQSQYYGKEKKDDGFLRVKPDCDFTVRFIGKPVKVVRIFTYDKRCINIDNEGIANRLKARYPSKIDNISIRYACWCFDRYDGKMKILDMPTSVFSSIGNRMVTTGKEISTVEEGCDWAITTNGKQGMDVRYQVDYLEENYLTRREQNMVEDQKIDKRRKYDLTKTFPSYDFLEAEEKLSITVR